LRGTPGEDEPSDDKNRRESHKSLSLPRAENSLPTESGRNLSAKVRGPFIADRKITGNSKIEGREDFCRTATKGAVSAD
jgi:hypothetical protein